MISTVLSWISLPMASWIRVSFSGSREAVASSRKALPLPARQGLAVFSDHRVVPLGKLLDEFLAAGRAGSGHNLRPCGIFFPDFNVVVNGVIEQHHILKNDGKIGEQGFRLDAADIPAADENSAAVHIPKARSQFAQGAFAASRGTDQRCDLSLSGRKGYVVNAERQSPRRWGAGRSEPASSQNRTCWPKKPPA